MRSIQLYENDRVAMSGVMVKREIPFIQIDGRTATRQEALMKRPGVSRKSGGRHHRATVGRDAGGLLLFVSILLATGCAGPRTARPVAPSMQSVLQNAA